MYHFPVTVTLTSDLVFKVITMSVPLRVRCISPIFFEVGISNLIQYVDASWDGGMSRTIFRSL